MFTKSLTIDFTIILFMVGMLFLFGMKLEHHFNDGCVNQTNIFYTDGECKLDTTVILIIKRRGN